MKTSLIKTAFGLALGEIAYIGLVVTFMNQGKSLFEGKPELLLGVMLLTLLVMSASVSGALLFGKPILLYLEGEKRDAVTLFGATLGWLFTFLTLIALIVVFFVR